MSTSTTQQESTPHDRPLRREDLVLEELDGEAVLYDPRCGAVHRFDALTLFVWDACDGSHSAADISRAVTATYDVNAHEASGHVVQVIAGFCTRDLLANGCGNTAKLPAEREVGAGIQAVYDVAGAAETGLQTGSLSAPVRRNPSPCRLLSRRSVLRGGAKKLAFAAPVISTFFARPAYASNPIHPAWSAFGAGGCKNVGYSCTGQGDCCYSGPDGTCEDSKCCFKNDRGPCTSDNDCCSGLYCNAVNECATL
jgi:hypothetical protein